MAKLRELMNLAKAQMESVTTVVDLPFKDLVSIEEVIKHFKPFCEDVEINTFELLAPVMIDCFRAKLQQIPIKKINKSPDVR